MAIYSIRDLEKLTGIKAHTIRIWEQRYRLISPARTETNIRFYTDENLRHLFNVALLNRHGHKISKLAKMRPDEIADRVAEISESSTGENAQIDALTLAMIDMDEPGFERIFANSVAENGFERTMLHLVYPFLDKLKLLWLTNSISPAHEKFVGNLIRRKLMAAIDHTPLAATRDTALFVLYTPEDENQELTLLFVYYLLRMRQHRVVYLGANTGLSDLRDVCEPLQPDYVFTILQEPPARQPIQAYIDSAGQTAGQSQLLLTGAQLFVSPVKIPDNARVLNGMADTIEFLDNLPGRHRG